MTVFKIKGQDDKYNPITIFSYDENTRPAFWSGYWVRDIEGRKCHLKRIYSIERHNEGCLNLLLILALAYSSSNAARGEGFFYWYSHGGSQEVSRLKYGNPNIQKCHLEGDTCSTRTRKAYEKHGLVGAVGSAVKNLTLCKIKSLRG